MRMMHLVGAAVFVALASCVFPGGAAASSPGAWEGFHFDLYSRCVGAAQLENPVVTFDSTGTQNYGVALVTGTRPGQRGRVTLVCVGRKTRGGLVDIEVSGETGEFEEYRPSPRAPRGRREIDPVVGAWRWFNGTTVMVNANGTVQDSLANHGTWVYDEGGRAYVLRWKIGGWVDTMRLSVGADKLEGRNQQGARVHGTRIR